jgi:DNA uptake protein ComE-like DNA-binding protein
MKTILRVSLFITAVVTVACKPSQPSAEYLAACEGTPLRTMERRHKAMEDGYEIDRRYDCITKRSAQALAEQKAQWEAANTPEARAARQAESEQRAEESKRRLDTQRKAETEANAERERRWAAAEQMPIDAVEINAATESELANLQGLSVDVAQQIVTERAKGNFKSWDDVVRRVVGLSAAETAVRASAFGLTVNGKSLEGAEPDSASAVYTRDKWRRRNG